MINKAILDLLFKGFVIQRWNDKLRPIELVETDKHAHKMMIAWILAKYEEMRGVEFEWQDIIRGGIFEYIRRVIISDIQLPVFREFEKNSVLLAKLDEWVYTEFEKVCKDKALLEEFRIYLFEKTKYHPHSLYILDAAHRYSTFWEFQIIKNLNVNDYKIPWIDANLHSDVKSYESLEGIKRLIEQDKVRNLVDLFGQMRYQVRWGQLARIPRTTVLGHSFFVAVLTWILSRKANAKCAKRYYNNFFGALLHDLPEAVTRDIISPLKSVVEGMSEEIRRIEEKLTQDEIYPHVEKEWIEELNYFLHGEFDSKISTGECMSSAEISAQYDYDENSPYDGELVRTADKLAAFLEAWNSVQTGIRSQELENAVSHIRKERADLEIGGVNLKSLYEEFN